MNAEYYFLHAPTAQLIINPFANDIQQTNKACADLLGLPINEIPDKAACSLFSASYPELIVFTEECIHKGTGWSDQLLLHCRGDELRVETFATWNPTGRYLHMNFQQADLLDKLRIKSDAERQYNSGIGHWNRVNKVFREFERENQLLLEAAGEGIYGVDANGMTSFVNPAAQRILGYNAEELAGTNMHTLIHHSRSDGKHYDVENCPIFQAFREGKVKTVESDVFWSKNHTRIDVEYTSTPIRDNGIIIGAVVVFRDISQKNADKRKLLEALEEVEKLKNRLELENAYLNEEINSEFNFHQIVGKSAAIHNLQNKINLVAPTDATVLITGESGTGKELIARAIHDMSARSERPLIRVNCAAIPHDLFESEFFGHARGAFTGATSERPGRFELADGGTLFLDEVSEIPLQLQGKLLRVLQEQQFERVGESKTRDVNVRIIAATNKKLKQLAESGEFREDLYFRLNVFPIESAPLRQRKEDIPLLTVHFLEKACTRANKPLLKISLSEIKKLKSYAWPGNIRELENIIEREVILSRGDNIHFSELIKISESSVEETSSVAQLILTDEQLKLADRRNLIKALEKCHGKIFGKGGVAELLQMKPTTVASRISKYQLDQRDFKNL